MTLGAEHVQPTLRDHFLAVAGALGFRLGQHFLPLFLGRLGDVDPVTLAELLARQPVRVAAEQDVHAAPGHVRRDGDRTGAARLRDDHGLALVLLGVEHLMLHASRSAILLSRSLVSIAVVPTSTGWPRFWRSLMSGHGLPLALLRHVDLILVVDADVGQVGRDDRHFER